MLTGICRPRTLWGSSLFVAFIASGLLVAENADFHNAPEWARNVKNPFEHSSQAAIAGKSLYHLRCARCHGERGEGSGNIPALRGRNIRRASSGEIFWFITKGDVANEMPSWANLPEEERWKIVSYVKSMSLSTTNAPSAPSATRGSKSNLPPSQPPFADFRSQEPGKPRKITPSDLPAPYATKSAENSPKVVARPADAWPKAPKGFKVELYASGLENPRLLRAAPNGDVFLAESDPGQFRVFRGMTGAGKPKETRIFADGLKRPYGIAFYPPGPNPEWVYVGSENKLVRFPYQNGDMKARGNSEELADLPSGGHWTRSVEFSKDGKILFVAVGSESNVDDPDTTAQEENRATILAFDPSGSGMRVYAAGIRNAGGGLAVNPRTGDLWCSVNEKETG